MSTRKTMADIGRLAGVSASTVSRALKGNPSIPPATRERIFKIAEAHHYVLDVQAQNFRLGRSQTIATVFPYAGESQRMISDPFYMEILGAITDELDSYGYDMLVSRVPSSDESWPLRYIMNKRVDGLILIDRAVNDAGIDKLQNLGANFVVWGPALAGQACLSVGGNSLEGAAMAVRHLAAMGRRKIGFVGGNQHMVETWQRRLGYEKGILESGLPLNDALVTYTDFTPQAAHNAIAELLGRAPGLDAVFLCSDFMAIAAMQEIRAMGKRVPEDIAVIGYDDIQLAAHCTPRLTTVRQEIYDGGRLMVKKLFELIEGKPAESSMLPIQLMVRDSCGYNQGK